MTIIELKDQIMKKNLSNFYIFTGVEIGIINIYLEQMSKTLGMPIQRVDTVSSVIAKSSSGSLFGSDYGFYVVRDDTDFAKQEEAYLNINSLLGKSTLVLLYDKIDSRLKFGKHFKDDIIAFEKLTPNVLKSYIKKAIDLSDKNIDTLMELCGGSYDMCMLEIDKIKQYAFSGNYPIMPDSAFIQLLEIGVIYQPEETDVFKFTDAVCSHKTSEAYKLERILRENNNSSITVLGTLYNSMKCVMLIQCCEGNNISEITGLDNRQIYFNKKYSNKYSTSKLVQSVKLINSVVSGVKSGWIEDEFATRYVLANIM